ncbi:MAG: NYN domain-containing protein [Coriobacteriales bacterium]|jgi:hypothetical protein|nr:NYN domain-containing protein [Coriobacteriales bacterium]
MADTNHIAVLIDSENISAHYISAVLDEVAAYGIASVRRIYGDWTSPHAVKWKDALLDNSLTPMQQFGNTSHKNSTDSAMIIDAMDILYSGDVNGYCIVSSDSDFTRLASRLRESGALVLGMGEEKTPLSFRKACTKFVTLENLIKSDEVRTQESVLDVSKIERTVSDIIVSNEGLGKRTRLSGVGNELSNKYSDFDVRNYGYSSLSRFLDEMPRFDLVRDGNDYLITLSKTAPVKEAVTDLIKEALIEAPHQEMGLSELGNIVRNQFSDFDQRDYGYTQFSKFVASIKGVQLVHSEGNRQSAVLDTQA